jgi:hypothetical protein
MSVFSSFATKNTSTPRRLLLVGLLFVLTAFMQTALAQGDLLITPKRVVFDGPKRSEDINLANTGKDTATFVISMIQFRMTENGSFEPIQTPDPEQLFAEPYLRIFPRQVTLAPNESQTIKVQLRKAAEMKEGEYRSHLYFRAVPKEKPLGEKSSLGDSTTIAVRLRPIYGISIPVIVKVGTSDAQVLIDSLALQQTINTQPMAQLTFRRTGNMSVYGDIAVNHVSKDGKVTKVGIAKGFAVYTPNKIRNFVLPLDKSVPVDYQSGKLQVIYTDVSAKPAVLAQKEIPLK